MDISHLTLFAAVFAAAFATAAFTLVGAAVVIARRQRRVAAEDFLSGARSEIAFLFEEDWLLDATPAARALLATAAGGGSDWMRLAGLLRHRFPELDSAVAGLADAGRVELTAEDDSGDRLAAEWHDGVARIALLDAAVPDHEDARIERQSVAAMEAEIETLRTVAQFGPAAIWRQGPDGMILWANDVYFALATEHFGPEVAHSWPPPALFPLAATALADSGSDPAPMRAAIRPEDGRAPSWFEVHGYLGNDDLLCYAVPADGLVHAEEALREFVQTLSKTFAQLPIGLAVFDRGRRLALFNPALTDLTGLEIEFLTGRPTLFAVLDRLRDRRRIPEPRDYGSWRQRMADIEAAASDGFVQELWNLPSGQTYRVTGRPHPDGGIAFLLEDISAEVSLTRRFRAEIELSQSVLDSLDEAIAVFSANGTITFSNAAYAALWGVDPASTLAETGVIEATRLWQTGSAPTPVWGDLRDFLNDHGERAEWSAEATLTDGRRLDCRFVPLPGGATLVGFTEAGERTRGSATPPRSAPEAMRA